MHTNRINRFAPADYNTFGPTAPSGDQTKEDELQ